MSEKEKIHDYSKIMSACIAEGAKWAGFTKTNPMVGAAVVKDGKVISYGAHQSFGSAHAEVNAINSAGSQTKGADLVVTLEPCSTSGKTPPCTDLIISSGIKNVYIGILDPSPEHSGKGVHILKNAGIGVNIGIEAEKCALLAENFIKSKLTALPYVTMKIAMSADGRIATKTGDSKWITSEEARRYVHKVRGLTGAVMTGIGTAITDDPMLNDRLDNALRQPIRIILDGAARLPLNSKLIKTCHEIPVIVYVSERASSENIEKLRAAGADVEEVPISNGKLDLDFILKSIYKKDIMDVFVEGGSSVFGSFRDADAADKLELFIAPKLIGGAGALPSVGGEGVAYMKDVKEFYSMECEMCHKDVLIHAKIKDYTEAAIKITKDFIIGN